MEAWTSGKESGSARAYWLKSGPYQSEDMFSKDGEDWRMYGWDSELDLCRAYGNTFA